MSVSSVTEHWKGMKPDTPSNRLIKRKLESKITMLFWSSDCVHYQTPQQISSGFKTAALGMTSVFILQRNRSCH